MPPPLAAGFVEIIPTVGARLTVSHNWRADGCQGPQPRSQSPGYGAKVQNRKARGQGQSTKIRTQKLKGQSPKPKGQSPKAKAQKLKPEPKPETQSSEL